MVEKQGSDNPIPVVYGTRRIGGIKVHKYVTDASGGAENEYLHLIVPLCEGTIDSIVEVFFDGVSENDAKWTRKVAGITVGKWFTIERFLGEPDQPASASAVSQIPNWTVNHQLRGIAYLYIRVQMDKEQSIWRGEPAITATVRGRKILDPRSGLIEYSENPALQLLDYLTNTVYGKGLPLARLNQPSFLQAADLADEQLISDVTINEITTELSHRRFTSNVVLDTGQSVFNNVKKLLSGMRGLLPIGSGYIRLAIETSGEPVFHFSHGSSEATNHATITGPVKTQSGRKADRYNRVIVRFPNRNTEFENDEIFYPADDNPLAQQWLIEDNGIRLEQSFEFETITSKAEAYQMAEIIAKRSRNRLECSFSASPAAIQVEPGDIVSVTDDTRGWDAKPFRVEQVKLEEDGDCDIELIEHQNAIYPWSGTSYSERVGGTNLGDPANIPAPTGLSIAPDPTFATAGRLTWNAANNAFIRRFKVGILNGQASVFNQEVLTPPLDLPLLATGNYTIQVYAVSTLGTLSPPAAIAFELNQPLPPSSIQLTSFNFEIEAQPVLAGSGLGTQFEFDIIEGDGTGHEPQSKARGATATFVGLKHNTLYTVFARTINALGSSEWVNASITTTADASNVIDLISAPLWESIFQPAVDDLQQNFDDAIELVNGTLQELGQESQNLKLQISTETLNRQQSDQAIFNAAFEAVQLRKAQGDLTNAIFEVDPVTGTITNRAYAYTDNAFTQAGVLIDGVAGEVAITAGRVTSAENRITNAEAQLQVQAGQISLKASYTDVNNAIAGAIDAVLPAYGFNFFNSAEGWVALNGTLTPGSSKILLELGDIANSALNYSADDNPLISISIERTGGTGWIGSLEITFEGGATQLYPGVIEDITAGSTFVRNLSLSGEASYTGTVTGIRLVLGATTADTFTVSSITVGKPSAALTELEGITAQVNQLGLDINAIDGKFSSYVSTTFYDANAVTRNNVESVLNGTEAIISLTATQQAINDDGIIEKANAAAVWIDAANSNITQVVEAYNAQPGGVDEKLEDINDSFTIVQSEIDAVKGISREQMLSVSRLDNKERDLAKNALLAEYQLYQAKRNLLDVGVSLATADRTLQTLSDDQGALAQEVLDLKASTGTATGQLNAAVNQVNQALTTEQQARASAISTVSADGSGEYSALAETIQQAKSDIEGNTNAISGIKAAIVGPGGDAAQAEVILQATVNNAGEAYARAFIGTTAVIEGVAVVNGLVIDGETQGIEIRGNVFGLSTTQGIPVLYWTAEGEVLNIRARIVLQDGYEVQSVEDIRAQDGEQGPPGPPGENGAAGAGFYGSTYSAISWTTSTANSRFSALAGRAPVGGDIFTQTRTDGTDSQARQYNGSGWGTVALQVNGSIVAKGTIAGDRFMAGSEISAPVITGGSIRMIGANAMSIESQTPFGPHNLLEWKGPRQNGVTWNNTTSQPILSGLTKGNASYYYSAANEVYFAGSILAGTLKNAAQSTQLGANTQVETGLYGSNGGTITIKCSFSASNGQSGAGSCPAGSNPVGTMYLDRWNGGGWVQVASQAMIGAYACSVESGKYYASWMLSGSFTFTDNLMSTANRNYRLRVSHTTPVLGGGAQMLSIISEE